MDHDHQIFIPDSFTALHATPGGRPTLPRAELIARYELCEDMANALVEHCQAIHFRDGVDEIEVPRTAELLGWPLQFEDNDNRDGG